MWKLIVKSTALVFLACLAAGVGVSFLKAGAIAWVPILVVSMGLTAIAAGRFYFMLREERAKRLRRLQIEVDAVQEIIDGMARLSPGDLSVYVAAHQKQIEQGDEISFCTAGGSANHDILVQMADLGLTAPAHMESIGDGEHRFVMARYRLTSRGRASLGNLLEIVGKRRRYFASQQGWKQAG